MKVFQMEAYQPWKVSALGGMYLLSQCYDAFCRRSPFLSARNMHLFHGLEVGRMLLEMVKKSASLPSFAA